MNTPNGIIKIVQRKEGIGQSAPQRYMAVRKAAETLSRRNADQAVIELMMEALQRLVDLCFEEDIGGLCNIDVVTGKVLLPLPWGRNGHQRWGLRPHESNILREIMQGRQYQPGLFTYDKLRRCWRINLHDFPTYDLAMNYLTRYQIGIAEYRTARTKRLGNV
jgi:hypothetical protein